MKRTSIPKLLMVAALLSISLEAFAFSTSSELSLYIERGMQSLRENENDLAIGDFNTAIRLDPNSAQAYCGRGTAYMKKKSYELALRDFETAIKINPFYGEAIHNRDVLFAERERQLTPAEDYSRYLDAYPDRIAIQQSTPLLTTTQEPPYTAYQGTQVLSTTPGQTTNVPLAYANGAPVAPAPYYQQSAPPVAAAPAAPAVPYYPQNAPAGSAVSETVITGSVPMTIDTVSTTVNNPNNPVTNGPASTLFHIQESGLPIDSRSPTARVFQERNYIMHQPFVSLPSTYPPTYSQLTMDQFAESSKAPNMTQMAIPGPIGTTTRPNVSAKSVASSGFILTTRVDPMFANDFVLNGIALNQAGQYGAAVTSFTEALKSQSNSAIAYNNRGYAYAMSGDYASALRDFTEALMINPYYADAQSNRLLLITR